MNITMIHGDSYARTVSCARDGTPVPFVDGDTVYFTVKKGIGTTAKVLQREITAFTDGKATIEILPSDKAAFGNVKAAVEYVYDIQVNFANGAVKTIVEPSTITILPGVTDE